jgi:hypothetical protein
LRARPQTLLHKAKISPVWRSSTDAGSGLWLHGRKSLTELSKELERLQENIEENFTLWDSASSFSWQFWEETGGMEMLLTLPPASSAVALTDCGYRRVACWNSSSSADCDSRTLLFALRNSGISSRSLAASRKPFVRSQRVGRGGAVKKIAASITTGEAGEASCL